MLRITLLLVSLLALVFAEPKLLVSKTILDSEIISTKELTVNIKIFNVGDSSAYNIKLEDSESWPEGQFSFVYGLPVASWERLPAGENVTHTFVLKVNRPSGYFATVPAKVLYTFTKNSAYPQRGSSTDLGVVPIYRASLTQRKTSPHLFEWFVFSILAGGACAAPFYVWRFYTKNFFDGLPKGK
eukprot:TRINITY_DN51396_c0_g1_i2.p2 TRINITY_DN51396_c0_g1~~TRINITY_DN51396_c0_g1_i2.p2  ORF type:complete len:185 (-),score=40.39 TRINITY_DN51396_c0_g1_i2:27-581(-)